MNNAFLFLTSIGLIACATAVAARFGAQTLATLITLLCISSNIFVLKEVEIFGIHATAAEGFAVGAMIALNLLQELYGRSEAYRALVTSFGCSILFTLLSLLVLWYHPCVGDSAHEHLLALFSPMPRLIGASLASFLASQLCDTLLYQAAKKRFPSFSFVARNYVVSSISLALDTLLFSLVGLYGLVGNIKEIMLFCYTTKMLVLALATPITEALRSLGITPLSSLKSTR